MIYDTQVNATYEQSRDLLYLQAVGSDMSNAYGEECEEGVLLFKNEDTDEFIGITVMDTCRATKKRQKALRRMGVNIDLMSICQKQ